MVQKRPYDEEEIFKISFKHPRQIEDSKQLFSFSESVFSESASEMMPKTLEDGFTNADSKGDGKFSGDIVTDVPKDCENIETSAPGSISSSWPAASEEESMPEAHFRFSFFPEYFIPERPIRTIAHCEDIYSLLLNHPSRKSVPIGSNHQAEVPPWGQQGTSKISGSSYLSEGVLKPESEDEKRLIGKCIIPMPDFASPVYTDPKIGSGRTDCYCEDEGSLSCARKHITEARGELVRSLGLEVFSELGFHDMGEQVAQTWSEEDEHAFHQVVFSNPASLGKNFWDRLSFVFPSRTKKEIVSYYFNVFMLRKRAEQNRYDPKNVDSDNDEWQGSDDFGDNEIDMSEDDDDSVVESPVYGHGTWSQEDNLQCSEHIAEDTSDDNINSDSNNGGVDQSSEICPEKLDNFNQHQNKIALDEKQNREVQDDSCTTSDTGVTSLRNHMSENGNRCLKSFSSNGYVLEPCDSGDWELGYMTSSRNKVDFLPTCNMIEEVFGEETLNHKVRDGKTFTF
ncbi:hypothetical protein G4B88_027896 [Cannabis sativa]|jgi:hypothetical protein|uniref:Uncharacterized protein n=1 Tax=Cannabis sativa TaxID=3483 RepID=A0A7J6I7J5_CANSA|nr:hypothetical protein G4B88_027896 [Cannabis sativa]